MTAAGDAQAQGVTGSRGARERTVAVALVVVGFVAAAALSPADHGLRTFLWNLAYYWGPQALVLVLLLPFRARAAVHAGTAAAMTLHFVAFDAWIHTMPAREALAWLYYLFSFPGALAGAAAAALVSRRRPRARARRAGLVAAALTLLGIALNHLATALTAGFGL